MSENLNQRTKETAQAELIEKFGMRKTSDFQEALLAGDTEKAEKWLQYIIEHKEDFPQYNETWEDWVNDRKNELADPESIKRWQEAEERKKKTQEELFAKFNMRKTSDFIGALKRGEIEKAEEWLQYIIEHKDAFTQYHATWDQWLDDRRRELSETKGK